MSGYLLALICHICRFVFKVVKAFSHPGKNRFSNLHIIIIIIMVHVYSAYPIASGALLWKTTSMQLTYMYSIYIIWNTPAHMHTHAHTHTHTRIHGNKWGVKTKRTSVKSWSHTKDKCETKFQEPSLNKSCERKKVGSGITFERRKGCTMSVCYVCVCVFAVQPEWVSSGVGTECARGHEDLPCPDTGQQGSPALSLTFTLT